jgi:prepilin-type N-terminal cleavage/methylation domain-containing protein
VNSVQNFPLVVGAFGVIVSPAMKTLPAKAKISGLTLIEVLVVIFVLAILAAMLLPALVGGGPHSTPKTILCEENQRQIAVGFIMWKEDNAGKFPWQISSTNNGTMEFISDGQASSQFRAILDYVKGYKTYICPTDTIKHAATNNGSFNDENVSYFVNFNSGTNDMVSIFTGGRHLEANYKPVKPGLFVYSNSMAMNWTLELHGKIKAAPIGVISFLDGHGEVVRGLNLNSIFQRQGSTTNRLAVP